MKINCTLEEYTRMIRMCQRGADRDCSGCVLAYICGDDLIEDAVQFEIEDDDQLEIEYVTFERRE